MNFVIIYKFDAHFFTAFLMARDGRKWGKRTLENGKGTWKHFLCPLAIFQCPLAPFSAVSCLQEGCDNRTVENSTTRGKVRWGSVMIFHKIHICNLYGLHEPCGSVSSNVLIEKKIPHKIHICNLYCLHELFWCVSSNFLLEKKTFHMNHICDLLDHN